MKTTAAAQRWSRFATFCECNPDFLSLKDPEKRTPLHAAAFLGDAEITELLILSGKTFSRSLFLLSIFMSYLLSRKMFPDLICGSRGFSELCV